MAKALKRPLTTGTLANSPKVRSMARVNRRPPVEIASMELGRRINYNMDLLPTPMADHTMASGKIANLMAKASTSGQMVGNTRGTLSMALSMVRAPTHNPTVVCMLGSGTKV